MKNVIQNYNLIVTLLLLATTVSFGVVISFNFAVGVMLAILPIAIFLFIYALKKTSTLLIGMIFAAASITAFREVAIEIGNTDMTLAGFVWITFAIIILIYLVGFLRKIKAPRYSVPFFLFIIWAIMRWVITPTGFAGIKDILWYSFPFLIILYISSIYKNDNFEKIQNNTKSIEKVFLISILIPILLYLFALLSGLATITSRGPTGDVIDSRAIPLYVLIVMSIALANTRYGNLFKLGRFTSAVSLGLIWFTLARMASFIALALVIFRYLGHKYKWQIFLVAIVTITISYFAIINIPALRDRFFFIENWTISTETGLQGINTAGRDRMWSTVYASATESWLIGKGLGTSRQVTATLFVNRLDLTEYHPHNEYLQIFHDLGIIGLALIIISWGIILFQSWERLEKSPSIFVKKWNMAATMAIGAVVVSALTDNTLHYPFVVIPTIIIVAIAEVADNKYRSNQRKQTQK